MIEKLAPFQTRKERGAFFTPPKLAQFLTDWAIQSPTDRVLEPSSGEAEFLLAAGRRLQDLGAGSDLSDQLRGVEIHFDTAAFAAAAVTNAGFCATVEVADFFARSPDPKFDAVVGNPPYVRYQHFTGAARSKAQEAALAQGVQLPGLASSWAAFVVHAASFLKPSGRLALVLPAELLAVNYAGPVRAYLMRRFASVKLILFEERVFPGVSEEVILLLAEGEGPTEHCDLHQAPDLDGLDISGTRSWIPAQPDDKWIAGLLPSESLAVYAEATATEEFGRLDLWGDTNLGMVTGNNRYFSLTAEAVRALELPSEEVIKISPPSSKHLKGLTFSDYAWRQLAAEDARVYLFYPNERSLSKAAVAYIAGGERDGVHKGYKCRMRSPWWQVPTLRIPDLFLTYMNHGAPRLVANAARVRCLNSTHGVNLRPVHRKLGTTILPIAFLNSLTSCPRNSSAGHTVAASSSWNLAKVTAFSSPLLSFCVSARPNCRRSDLS